MKLFIIHILASILRIPFVRGKVTISEFFYKLLKPTYTIVKMKVCDCYITLDLSQREVRYIYFGAYEKAERKFLNKFLRAAETAVDVGANYGYLSAVMLCKIGKSGKVYGFEPNPGVYESLSSLTESSDGRFRAYNLAVSDNTFSDGIKFYVNHEHSMWASTIPEFTWAAQPEVFVVESVRLTDFFLTNQIDKISLIKIDVEGGEADVLKGLIPFLENHHKSAIFCEITPSTDERWLNVIEQIKLLLNLGYKIYQIDKSGNLTMVSFNHIKNLSRQINLVFAMEDDIKSRDILTNEVI